MNGLPPSGFGPGRSVEPSVLADAEPPPRPHAVKAPAPRPNAFEADVRQVLDEVRRMLVEKNCAYGDSVLNPVRVFSRAPAVEQLLVRIDDKLSRLAAALSPVPSALSVSWWQGVGHLPEYAGWYDFGSVPAGWCGSG